MRHLALALMILASSLAQAETLALPEATVSSKILGGTVLMIQMKYTLVIDGDAQMALTRELGQLGREKLFRDLILSKDVAYIKIIYGAEGRSATNNLISKYESLGSQKLKLKLTMN